MGEFFKVFVVLKSKLVSDEGSPIVLNDIQIQKWETQQAAESWVKQHGSKDYTYTVIKFIKPD